MRILLAERDSGLRSVLARRLRRAGLAVDEVADAAAVEVAVDVTLVGQVPQDDDHIQSEATDLTIRPRSAGERELRQ